MNLTSMTVIYVPSSAISSTVLTAMKDMRRPMEEENVKNLTQVVPLIIVPNAIVKIPSVLTAKEIMMSSVEDVSNRV